MARWRGAGVRPESAPAPEPEPEPAPELEPAPAPAPEPESEPEPEPEPDAPELTPWEKECKQKRMANPQIYGNPVFDLAKDWRNEVDDKTKAELGEDDEGQRQKLWKFQEIYAMADIEHDGYLGRQNFRGLLKILDIDVEGDKLEEKFAMMDENNDNQIDFGGESLSNYSNSRQS
jgi:hypothetical protein